MFGGVLCDTPDSILNDDNNETNELYQYNSGTVMTVCIFLQLLLQLYFTEKDVWKTVNHSGDVPPPCSGATMACVDRYLYLFGGLSVMTGWLDNFYIFNTGRSNMLQ